MSTPIVVIDPPAPPPVIVIAPPPVQLEILVPGRPGPPGPPGSPGTSGVSAQDLEDHVESLTPHPVYDDGPSLVLLYENVKV